MLKNSACQGLGRSPIADARVRYTTLKLTALTLKQMAAAGHDRAAALYTRFATCFGRQQTESEEGRLPHRARTADDGGMDGAIFTEGRAA